MVTVSGLFDRDLLYVPIGSSFSGGTWNGRGFKDGRPFLALNPLTLGPPTFTDTECRFGLFRQGKQNMGRLHDRDVRHLNASGRVLVSELLARSVLPSGPTDYLYRWFGRLVLGGTTQSSLCTGIVPWGSDTVCDFVLPLEKYLDTTVVPNVWREPTTRTLSTSVKFNGDYGVVIVHRPKVVKRTEWQTEAQGVQVVAENYYARFFRVVRGTGGGVRHSTSEYTATWGPGYWYFNINGHTVKLQDLGPDPGTWGISYYTANLPSYRQTLDVQADTATLYQTIVDDLSCVKKPYRLRNFVSSIFGIYPISDASLEWGELGSDIIKQQKYVDVNLLLTAFDLAFILDDLDSWKRIVENIRFLWGAGTTSFSSMKRFLARLKRAGKTLSNVWLSIAYGVNPSVSDARAACIGLGKILNLHNSSTRLHARRSSAQTCLLGSSIQSTRTLTAEVAMLPADFSGDAMWAIREFKKWGLYPNLSTLYDLIPFSFAVDWVVNFGSIIKDADIVMEEQYFPIRYCILGEKRTWSPPVSCLWPSPGVSGCVEFSLYDRYMLKELPIPLIQVGEAFNGSVSNWAGAIASNSGKHWVEAISLIVQRVR